MNERRSLDTEDRVAEILLGAARNYRPPSRLRRRVVESLGLPFGVALGTSATAASAAFATGTASKAILAVVAVVGVGSVGVGMAYRADPAPRPAVTQVTQVNQGGNRQERQRVQDDRRDTVPMGAAGAPQVPGPEWGPQPSPRNLATGPGAQPAQPTPSSFEVAAPAAPSRRSTSGASPALPRGAVPVPLTPLEMPVAPPEPAAVSSSALAAEIELLDRVQVAVRRLDHRTALAGLAEHDQRFATGALAQEAEVLRISALLGTGERGEGLARARRFLDRNGDGVLALRVRSMVAAEQRVSGVR